MKATRDAFGDQLVESGKDTPLYNYLEQNDLIEEARKFKIKFSYTMDTQPNYFKFKSSIPWDIANDKYFAEDKLRQN